MLSNISLNSQIESDERVGCLDIREFVDGKTFKRLLLYKRLNPVFRSMRQVITLSM